MYYYRTKITLMNIKCKKRIFFVFLSLFFTLFVASAQVNDTIVSLTPTNRNVLLEEYTGIACGYCPDGHRRANEIAAAHPGRVNIINIHTGTFSYNYYTTQFGSALAEQSGLTGYPAGTINRHVFRGSVTDLNRGYWAMAASQILEMSSPVNIAAEGTLDVATRALHVRIQLYYTGSQTVDSNALNLAIVQDNVLGSQNGMAYNPDQIVGNQYSHMHMLRHLVTGQWGETINTISQGTLVERTYDYVIPAQMGTPNSIDAPLDNLRFIAFVCEGHQEVLTSIEVPVQYASLPAIDGEFIALKDLENVECNEHGNAYFEFKNKGANTITSLTYTYRVNNGAVQTVTWNGNIPSWVTEPIQIPDFNLNLNANNTVTVQVTAINGVNVNFDSQSVAIKKNVCSGSGEMTFTLVTDMYASETTFKIFDPNGNVVLSGGPWENLSAAGTISHAFTFNPQCDGCYRLEVYDTYGDGINAGYGAGNFTMVQNSDNTQTIYNNGQFGRKATYMIDISSPTPPCTTVYGEFSENACNSYTWNGHNYFQSGDYGQTFSTANGCDSVVTLHLTINHGTYTETTVDTCGTEYYWALADTTVNQSGTYYHYSTNANTCIDTAVLMLALYQSARTELSVQICAGEVYDQNGFNVSTAGDHYLNLQTEHGCDSIVHLTLTVNRGTYVQTTVDTCGTEYNWALADTTVNQSGTYYYCSPNTNTCTDTTVLILSLYQSATTELTAQICAGEVYDQNGFNVGTAGDHYLNLQTAHGCDSIVHLTLTVNHGTYAETTVDTCGTEYYWALADTTVNQSGTYYYCSTNASTCTDTTVLMLSLYQSATTELSAQICAGEVYDQNGFNASTAGDHYLYLQTEHGCDSTVVLHLTVGSEAVTYLAASICEGDSYHENGFEIIALAAGVHEYSDTIGRVGTCDSIVHLTLTVNRGTYTETAVDTCGTEYYWALADTTVNQSGTYYYYSTNDNTCTDTAVLMLALYQSATTELSAQICAGEVYDQNGFNVSTAGDHYLNLQTEHGCDSTVILHLTVSSEAVTYLAASICEGDSYQENGFDIIAPSVGTHMYYDTIARPGTCDSVISLTLTVNAATSGDTTAVVNSSFDWYGQHLTTSGDYTSTLTNAAGCDSVVTLHLTVNYSATGDTTAIACDSFDWYEYTNLTQSGDYTHTFTNVAGGDSVVTLHLTLVESPALQTITGEPEICINQYATYHYDILDPNYQYRWLKDNVLWGENVPVMTLHEMGEGVVLVTMQVTDGQSGCAADTSMSVQVANRIAPDTTEVRRKVNTNILICKPVYSDYGQVHYRWGYTDLSTFAEVVMPGDRNYCLYDIGIDTLTYRYWVETYLNEAVGAGCENRSYYAYGYITTSTPGYGGNIVDAYLSGGRIILNVSALSPEDVAITLYDMNGKLLLTKGYGVTELVSDVIPVSFAPGIYLLNVNVGGYLYSFKLMKM